MKPLRCTCCGHGGAALRTHNGRDFAICAGCAKVMGLPAVTETGAEKRARKWKERER